jgi:predicted DNA-binding protein
MSIADSSPNKSAGVKTLAIRLEPELHAELSLIAQLREQTITDEIRQAIESHVRMIKTLPALADKADEVLADIERQAAARREAFARLFGPSEPTQVEEVAESASPVPPKPARGRRTTGTSDS